MYMGYFYLVDEFMALCFTVTGPPPAVRCTQILPVNQLIMLGMKGSNQLVDCFMALCFIARSAVKEWEFVYDLSAVGNSYQPH
jgi:hypothetical protein